MLKRANFIPGDWGRLETPAPYTPAQVEHIARDILVELSLEEKIDQMTGSLTMAQMGAEYLLHSYNWKPYSAGENARLGIPGVRFTDGPRGIVSGNCTAFPCSMARGASWDPALEEEIGDAVGVEGRSVGANFYGGVCINLLRHPAWGRAQETYGEDPHLLGEMGAGLVRGVQRHMMACVKHYACNSIENVRMRVNVVISPRTLHEVYLPHFRRCVQAGAAAVMSAYNKVNGVHCGHNRWLLRDILKDAWGFDGLVMSDFIYGVRDAKAAALGGLDIEMPARMHYGLRLKKLVERGEVPLAVVDEAVGRILRTKLRFGHVGEAQRYGPEAICSAQHTALARRAARESMVLLQNNPAADGLPLLPLTLARFERLAVIGRLADTPNTGDRGSSRVKAPYVVTPLQGLKAAWGAGEVIYRDGKSVPDAARLAGVCSAAVVVVGYDYRDEGEKIETGGDRRQLTLKPHDERLVLAVAEANPNTVVVLVTGSAVICEAWRDKVPALVVAWYAGMEGGHALAELLLGRANFSGKLPCTFPRSQAQLPFFDSNAREIEYGYYHGYRLLDKNAQQAAFPFGFGLSYTTFKYGGLRVERAQLGPADTLRASVQVTNSGAVAGQEVVQLYIGAPGQVVERPLKELKGFAKVSLQPAETRQVAFDVAVQDLAYYDEAAQDWRIEPGTYRLYAGGSSQAQHLLSAEFSVAE